MSSFDFLQSTCNLDGRTSPAYPQNRNETDRNETDHNAEATDDSGARHYEEFHPNVPLIFGSGPGLIDAFKADQHAEKRKENLYYPFSSKAEWGLALWLLRSGLLMRAIDNFLALPIVSPQKKNHNLIHPDTRN